MSIEIWEHETEQAWAVLQGMLGEWLTGETVEQSVIIALPWPDGDLEHAAPYVQMAVLGDGTVRSEAVSNGYLDPRFRLDEARIDALGELGWIAAEDPDSGGCRNFWRHDDLPEDAEVVAQTLVATLRDVYGVPAPSFLEVSGFSEAGPLDEDDLPFGLTVVCPEVPSIDVTAVVATDPDDLRDLVAAAVTSVVEHEVEYDADGDIPLPAGNTVVYVRVEETSPSVRLFASLLHDVRWTPRVGHVLNEANGRLDFARVAYHENNIIIEYQMFARPFVPELLRHAVVGLTGLVDGLDVELQGRIGGKTLADHQDGIA